MTTGMTRKQFLVGATTALAAPFVAARARAAKTYVIKIGLDLPVDHPSTTHLQSAAAEIKARTHGAVILQVFPNNQLGNDTHMLSNLRLGAMQMMSIGDNILADLVPAAAIDNLGFAFKDSKTAWAAVDGKVGALVRPQIEKAGLHPMHDIWDMGFREITTSTRPIDTPADLDGLKIRVPPSQMNVSLFKDLGAAPVTLNVSDLYSALQTKVVDGQETPLGVIEDSKWYQVQKYCSLTNHMWVGNWIVVNGAFWSSLPKKYQETMEEVFAKVVQSQRVANAKLNGSMGAKLQSQGLIFNTPERPPFLKKLEQAGYYKEWRGKLGPKLWSALETYTGTLS